MGDAFMDLTRLEQNTTLYSGRTVNVFDLRPCDIDLADIALRCPPKARYSRCLRSRESLPYVVLEQNGPSERVNGPSERVNGPSERVNAAIRVQGRPKTSDASEGPSGAENSYPAPPTHSNSYRENAR